MNSITQTEQTAPEQEIPNEEVTNAIEHINAVLEELIKTKLPPSLNRE